MPTFAKTTSQITFGNWTTIQHRGLGQLTDAAPLDSLSSAATTAAALTPNGFEFVDGGGGNDQINRNDGGDWLAEGYLAGGTVVVANSETPANDGTYTILAVDATDIDVATASFTAGLDDNTVTFSGGDGAPLVFEKGIWKYPEQGACGRVGIPTSIGTPMRLMHVMADLGASTDWTLHVANSNNTTDTPYPAADAAKYAEGDITFDSATSEFVAKSYYGEHDPAVIIFPGQRVYMTTVAASSPVVRFTFAPAFDSKG